MGDKASYRRNRNVVNPDNVKLIGKSIVISLEVLEGIIRFIQESILGIPWLSTGHKLVHSLLGTWVRSLGREDPLEKEMAPQLQHSCLENPMDGEAWWATVHRVAKSWTRLSDFTFHFHALEKETATHSSVLAWRIP